ncbi:hypothetical protein Pelo_18984 [Pelomyxa schiedti]|nr:hypothetical protein Pelo_18984 [Pelomyxa schiedti]
MAAITSSSLPGRVCTYPRTQPDSPMVELQRRRNATATAAAALANTSRGPRLNPLGAEAALRGAHADVTAAQLGIQALQAKYRSVESTEAQILMADLSQSTMVDATAVARAKKAELERKIAAESVKLEKGRDILGAAVRDQGEVEKRERLIRGAQTQWETAQREENEFIGRWQWIVILCDDGTDMANFVRYNAAYFDRSAIATSPEGHTFLNQMGLAHEETRELSELIRTRRVKSVFMKHNCNLMRLCDESSIPYATNSATAMRLLF